MTERQLIIALAIISEFQAKNKLNSEKCYFEQSKPLEIKMELAEHQELENIKTYLTDVLQDISTLVN